MGAIKPRAVCVFRTAVLALAALSLAACASVGPRYPVTAGGGDTGEKPASKYSGYRVGKPYEIGGRWYTPMEQPDYDEVGMASWYGEQFHNRYTADGEVFDMRLPSAAHKTLPLPSLVEVTNLANGRKIVVRVNDRGPFVDGRIIDLSREAATELGFLAQGLTEVRVRYVGQAPASPGKVKLYNAADAVVAQPAAKPSQTPFLTPPRSQPRTQIAVAGGALLGSGIDARPLQASPADVAWGEGAPAKVAPPPPAATDIDSLLDQLAGR
jgi:rare lipoprotein A